MVVVLGTDGYRYEVTEGCAKLPPGYEFNADVAAVGIDKHDNVYAFNRGKHPMCVFDRDGNLLRTWGEGIFPRAHGVFMAPDETIWLTDDADHSVRQCTLDGKGKYEAQWVNMHRPSGLYMEPGKDGRFYVGEIGPDMAVNINVPNCGPRVSIYSHQGDLLCRLGHMHAGLDPGQFISPHGLAVDSRGDIYVGEVSFTNWGRRVRAKGEELPPDLRSLQKLVKVG